MNAHWRYLHYLIRHKWYVAVANYKFQLGVPLWRLIIHDWSKCTPTEWGPYVTTFYGPSDQAVFADALGHWMGHSPDSDRIEVAEFLQSQVTARRGRIHDAFDRAWLHHQHHNPHHWQHWVLREDNGITKTLRMPRTYINEMVADWCGAGRVITGRWEVLNWYDKNKARMQLHPDTRAMVEFLLDCI